MRRWPGIPLVVLLALCAGFSPLRAQQPPSPDPTLVKLLNELTIDEPVDRAVLGGNQQVMQRLVELPDYNRTLMKLLADRTQPADLRARAVYGLGMKFPGDQLADALIAALDDPAEAVRGMAALQVQLNDDPRLPGIFRRHLKDTEPRVRAVALGYLARTNAPGVQALAAEALDDPDPRVQAIALVGLGKVKDARVLDRFAGVIGKVSLLWRLQAYRALCRFTEPRVLDLYAGALKEPVPEVRQLAVRALGFIRDPRVLPLLCTALHDDSEDVREAAGESLRRLRPLPVTAALLPLLGDDDPDVRAHVLDLLIALHPPELQEILAKQLADEDPMVRETAGLTLADRYLDPRAVKPLAEGWEIPGFGGFDFTGIFPRYKTAATDYLLRWLDHEDDSMRANAATMLAETGDPRALPALTRHLTDPDDSVREFSGEAITSIKRAQIAVLGDDPAAADRLVAMARDMKETPANRLTALQALEHQQYAGLADLVVALLTDARPQANAVKLIAAAGLVDDPRVITPLLAALQVEMRDADDKDRNTAADAFLILGAARDPRAIRPLFGKGRISFFNEYLDDTGDDPWGYHKLDVKLLLGFGKPAVDAALNLQKTGGREEREKAVMVLVQCGDPRVVEAFLAVLGGKDAGLHVLAANALGELARTGDNAFRTRLANALLRLLKDPDPQVKSAAIGALGACRDVKTVTPLLALLQAKSPVRRALITALGEIGQDPDGQVTARLLPLLDNKEGLQAQAAEALGKLGNLKAKEPLYAAWQRLSKTARDVEEMPSGMEGGDSTALLRALARLDDTRIIDHLIDKVIEDRFGSYYGETTYQEILALMPGPAATDRLLAALQEKDPEYRQILITVLGMRKDPRTVEPLISLLREPPPLSESYFDYHEQIVQALGAISDPRATDALVEALDDGILRPQAALALAGKRDARAVEPLIEVLTNYAPGRFEDEKGRALVGALVQFHDPRSVDVLLSILQKWDDTRTRVLAAEGLGALKEARAIDPLIALLHDADAGLRLAAGTALEQITGATLGCHYARWRTWRRQHP